MTSSGPASAQRRISAAGPEPDRPADLRPEPPPPQLYDPSQEVKTGRAPWSWATLDDDRESRQAREIGHFVAWFNRRYAWTPDHLIPACWAEHGALVEEITTLMWSHWAAFEGAQASPEAAQTWHTYILPMFLTRLARWLPGAALSDCQAGRHQPSRLRSPGVASHPPLAGRPEV